MPVRSLRNGILNGLAQLRALLLIGLQLITIENNLFAANAKTYRIDIIASMQPATTINQLLMNGTALPMLKSINFRNNDLADILTEATFGNLTTVENLYLSSNKITAIAEDTFHVIGKSLKWLSLSQNLLTTLPENIFKPVILTKQELKIFFYGNPWHCTGNLCWLQRLTKQHPSVFLMSACLVDICWNVPNTTTMLETSTTVMTIETSTGTQSVEHSSTISTLIAHDPTKTTTIGATVSTPESNTIMLNCSFNGNTAQVIFIRSEKLLKIVGNSKGGIDVHTKSFPGDYILIWYANKFPLEMNAENFVNCVGADKGENENAFGFRTKTVTVDIKLAKETTYIFCMAEKQSLLISPFDCISYYQGRKNN